MVLFLSLTAIRLLVLLSATLHVPSEYTEIQDAIDASSMGDTVLVGSGEYCAIDFIGKDIVVISEQGPEYTFILPTGGEWANVYFGGGETAAAYIGGFTITGVDSVASRGVCIFNSSPTISGNWVIDHKYVVGGCGLYIGSSSSIIENNLILNNICGTGPYSVWGGGICCTSGCSVVIRNNVIAGNYAIFGGGIGIDCYGSPSNLYLENNTIVDNTVGGNLYLEYADEVTIRNCILWGNEYFEISLGSYSDLDISWTDIEGGQEGIEGGNVNWGDGMIQDPPVFTSGSICEYELDETISPCVDAGDPSLEFNDPENPLNPGYALYPSLGLVRNDMGAFGGGGAENWTGISTFPDEVIEPRISVDRNPCRGILSLQIDLNDAMNGSVLITDLSGRVVTSMDIRGTAASKQSVSFNLHHLPAGMYATFLETATGHSFCRFVLLR